MLVDLVAFFAAAALSDQATPAAPGQQAGREPANEVKGVTIVGNARVKSAVDRRSYDIKSDVQYQSGSIADVLANVPSVSVDPEGVLKLRGDTGVTILIDGQPAPQLNGGNQANALQQMRATQFSRVEVMTNPSAAFGAEGGAGVINLVSRPARQGQSTTNLSASLTSKGGYNASVSQTTNQGPLSFTGAASHRLRKLTQSQTTARTFHSGVSPDQDRYSSQSDRRNQQTEGSLNLGWQLNPKDKATFEAGYFGVKEHNETASAYDGSRRSGAGAYSFQSANDDRWSGGLAWGAVSLRHALSGQDHYLLTRLRLSRQTEDQAQNQSYIYALSPARDWTQAMRRSLDQTTLTFKAEYKNALKGGELVVGNDLERLEADTGYDERGGQALLRSDPFRYRRTTGSVYATYKRTAGKLEFEPGARFEISDWKILQDGSRLSRRDVDLYPSLHLRYALNEDWSLGGSFAERVDRPSPADHDEFAKFAGLLSYTSGRRDLRPEKSRNYELELERNKGGLYYLATLYYRKKTDRIEATSTLRADGSVLETKSNVGDFSTGGVELVTSGSLGSTVSYKLTGQYSWNKIEPRPELGLPTRRNTTPAAQANLNWKVSAVDFIQVSVVQLAANLGQQRDRKAYRFVNAGYRRKLGDGLFATLTVADVFDNASTRENVRSLDFDYQTERRTMGRRFALSLSYALGRRNGRVDDRFDYGAAGS